MFVCVYSQMVELDLQLTQIASTLAAVKEQLSGGGDADALQEVLHSFEDASTFSVSCPERNLFPSMHRLIVFTFAAVAIVCRDSCDGDCERLHRRLGPATDAARQFFR